MLTDRSNELFKKVTGEYYNEVLAELKHDPDVTGVYMPVNTVGCCYLSAPNWGDEGQLLGDYVIPPGRGKDKWAPHGPVNIMLEICKLMASGFEKHDPKPSGNLSLFLASVGQFEEAVNEKNPKYDRRRTLESDYT